MEAFKRLFAVLPILVTLSCAISPLGRRQLIILPNSQMSAMGVQAFQEMKAKTPVESDAAINAYVRCVALPITQVSGDQTGVWEIVVFKDPTANAFALPGGKIGVHDGMLKVAKTADQLAAVLGHEVGHVVARHSAERVSEAFAAQGGLAAIDALTLASPNKDLLMGLLGVGAQFGVLLPHSRTQESEADLIGLDLMAKAGFDPQQSVELWKNMAASGGSAPPEWLSTHPANPTRIRNLQGHMAPALSVYQQARQSGRTPECKR